MGILMGKYTRSRDTEMRGRYCQEAILHGSMIVFASKELTAFVLKHLFNAICILSSTKREVKGRAEVKFIFSWKIVFLSRTKQQACPLQNIWIPYVLGAFPIMQLTA